MAKRGRPRKYTEEDYTRLADDPWRGVIGRDTYHTPRQQQNIILAERSRDYVNSIAVDLPDEDERVPPAALYDMGEWSIPQRVETELGRFLPDNTEGFWCAFMWYWKYRATPAHVAAERIRGYRLGRVPPLA